MTNTNWGERLKEIGVLWQHDGDYTKPHALLTSGNHSKGYNNGALLVENPKMLEGVCKDMIVELQEHLSGELPDYVCGPAMGAVTIGHEVARQLGTKFAFTEPVHTEEGKMQVLKRFEIPKGATVLVVEDAISTGGSMVKTIEVLEEAGATVLPFVATIVNWSGSNKLGEREIAALFTGDIGIMKPEECELCKCGSEALRPKAHWDKLTK